MILLLVGKPTDPENVATYEFHYEVNLETVNEKHQKHESFLNGKATHLDQRKRSK